MNARNKRIIDYLDQPAERKKVTNMLKAGKIKKVSGKKSHALNIKRNRIITIVLAWIFLIIGFLCVVF